MHVVFVALFMIKLEKSIDFKAIQLLNIDDISITLLVLNEIISKDSK